MLEVLRSALHRLRINAPADSGELNLNRELYFCMIDVNEGNRDLGKDCLEGSPASDAPNQPTPGTQGSASERKRPDIQWSYVDHLEPNARRRKRTFVVECKLLGSPSESGRRYNVQYVSDGVVRFADPDWRYGMDVATGAMVGYIKSLGPSRIVAEVNSALSLHGISALALPHGAVGPLIELEHSFVRPFDISPFRLVHLWIDV